MFEKEAKEYRNHNTNYYEWDSFCADDGEAVEEAYQKGAIDGYNKANEWHYVKDELPEKEKYVLVYTKLRNVYMAILVKDNYFINKNGGFVQTSRVIAWKEIVLPKEGE